MYSLIVRIAVLCVVGRGGRDFSAEQIISETAVAVETYKSHFNQAPAQGQTGFPSSSQHRKESAAEELSEVWIHITRASLVPHSALKHCMEPQLHCGTRLVF